MNKVKPKSGALALVQLVMSEQDNKLHSIVNLSAEELIKYEELR